MPIKYLVDPLSAAHDVLVLDRNTPSGHLFGNGRSRGAFALFWRFRQNNANGGLPGPRPAAWPSPVYQGPRPAAWPTVVCQGPRPAAWPTAVCQRSVLQPSQRRSDSAPPRIVRHMDSAKAVFWYDFPVVGICCPAIRFLGGVYRSIL